MDKLDWITFLAAITIVVIIAIVVNIPKMNLTGGGAIPVGSEISAGRDSCSDGSCCMPKTHYSYNVEPVTGQIEIHYNNNLEKIYSAGASGYPRINFPGSMKTPTGDVVPADKNVYYGGVSSIHSSDIFSDTIWEPEKTTSFAYMNGSKSGFSEIFGVTYPLWRIKSLMTPKGNPAYSSFTWILVDSSTGDVITGGDLLPGNQVTKKIEIPNKKYYFLLKAENVESFSLVFETPDINYYQAHINPIVQNLQNFLNTM
ncbi:hypothetical protein L1994_04180 [Methanomicrobium antiquum]|uniref:Uncharacterized protein n=1 Tax=Methanomicrobium antiquum TaxID=487686 RepID=A0AAF0FX54_9EURY|nr:hypothetical protein [Methanomicrobium antiquum]WFN37595.1 hypothetical protein L1994_04180 [Methanomicrobium antiquum]